MSFEGTLQVGETVLRAEIMDAGITDNAHLTGWLRLTNDTDQYLRTCAILDTMFVNQVQQIADYLAIDAGIEAHTVTWQRIDIPLYANHQLVDGELNAELDTAQQILGFGPEMLGLESITEIDSTSDEEEYLCRLHLYATEPLPVPHGEPVTGETVLET